MGWKFLGKRNNYELWETPGKFLVCWHYCGIFEFFNSYNEALEFFNKK